MYRQVQILYIFYIYFDIDGVRSRNADFKLSSLLRTQAFLKITVNHYPKSLSPRRLNTNSNICISRSFGEVCHAFLQIYVKQHQTQFSMVKRRHTIGEFININNLSVDSIYYVMVSYTYIITMNISVS